MRVWRPLSEEIYGNECKEHVQLLTTLSLTIMVHLHSFSCCCVRNLQNSLKIWTYTVQGHLRSSILVSIEGAYATSYQSLIVTLGVYPTVFKILTFKARKWLVFPTPPLFDGPLRGGPLEFMDETYPAKTRGMGLPYGENFIILASTVFLWSIHPRDRRTDGR